MSNLQIAALIAALAGSSLATAQPEPKKVESVPAVKAQQFVLFDATFTFTKEDADNSTPSKSHYYVRDKMLNADRPKDWTSPVDYRNGTVHIRAEVIEKPEGGAPTTWTLCYIPNKGLKAGYGCTGTGIYKEKGVYESDVKMTSFWQNDCIVWDEGIKEMHLVMKDDSGGNGHVHKRTDPEKFFPTKMRITMIQVAKGATYDPKLVPNLPMQKADADAEFLKKVIPGINASVNIVEYAAKNSSEENVKGFAERVAKQHKGAVKTAIDHAKRLKIEVVTDPDKDSKEMSDKLSKLKGADLDAAFLMWLIQIHEDTTVFDNEVKNGADTDLKAFAKNSIESGNQHLKEAKELLAKMKK
jgi:predicted outer membrane protein